MTNEPITTIADIKSLAKRRYLNFDYTGRYPDIVLDNAIELTKTMIETATGYIFSKTLKTDYFDGEELRGTQTLLLQNTPLLSVNSVKVNGETLTENEDYYTYPDGSMVKFEGYLPTTGLKNVVVEYYAGYSPANKIAKALCEELIVYMMLNERNTPPNIYTVISENEDGNKPVITKQSENFSDNIKEYWNLLPRKMEFGSYTF